MMLRTGRAAVQELLLRRKWPLGPVVADLSEAVDWIAADGERLGSCVGSYADMLTFPVWLA